MIAEQTATRRQIHGAGRPLFIRERAEIRRFAADSLRPGTGGRHYVVGYVDSDAAAGLVQWNRSGPVPLRRASA
jgi:hypothetical protein